MPAPEPNQTPPVPPLVTIPPPELNQSPPVPPRLAHPSIRPPPPIRPAHVASSDVSAAKRHVSPSVLPMPRGDMNAYTDFSDLPEGCSPPPVYRSATKPCPVPASLGRAHVPDGALGHAKATHTLSPQVLQFKQRLGPVRTASQQSAHATPTRTETDTFYGEEGGHADSFAYPPNHSFTQSPESHAPGVSTPTPTSDAPASAHSQRFPAAPADSWTKQTSFSYNPLQYDVGVEPANDPMPHTSTPLTAATTALPIALTTHNLVEWTHPPTPGTAEYNLNKHFDLEETRQPSTTSTSPSTAMYVDGNVFMRNLSARVPWSTLPDKPFPHGGSPDPTAPSTAATVARVPSTPPKPSSLLKRPRPVPMATHSLVESTDPPAPATAEYPNNHVNVEELRQSSTTSTTPSAAAWRRRSSLSEMLGWESPQDVVSIYEPIGNITGIHPAATNGHVNTTNSVRSANSTKSSDYVRQAEIVPTGSVESPVYQTLDQRPSTIGVPTFIRSGSGTEITINGGRSSYAIANMPQVIQFRESSEVTYGVDEDMQFQESEI